MQPRPQVLITHPERQHSHEIAGALHGEGWLSRYVHGAPLPLATMREIDGRHRLKVGFCRVARRAMLGMVAKPTALQAYYRMIWSFDWLMARQLAGSSYTAVVAYENSALHQFRVASELGMVRILDNAGVHHSLQDRFIDYDETDSFHRRIVARKDEELALADLILVCSSFAADSFVRGGVPREKIRTVTLGCDTDNFAPRLRSAENERPIRFLFVGRINKLKGADLLAQAAAGLRASGVPFSLDVVASLREAEPNCRAALHPYAKFHDKVAHSRLPALHAEADCLVLPSRFDSFGFVVAEALASGLPVIVSDQVGAKDLINENMNGWIVPAGDAPALEEKMKLCALNPGRARAMGKVASSTARYWSWRRYRDDVVQVLKPFLLPSCHEAFND